MRVSFAGAAGQATVVNTVRRGRSEYENSNSNSACRFRIRLNFTSDTGSAALGSFKNAVRSNHAFSCSQQRNSFSSHESFDHCKNLGCRFIDRFGIRIVHDGRCKYD